jgi:glycerate dehydrogenase
VAKSFGCRVVYYSTSNKNYSTSFKRVSLSKLLKKSDIVSIHAPLNTNTKNLIRLKELKKMKKTALIINMGRGGIIDEKALLFALKNGIIKGAGLDVMQNEPPKKSKLLKLNNISITPHLAWASVEARDRLISAIYNNIKEFIR